jgi:hypothetical protein
MSEQRDAGIFAKTRGLEFAREEVKIIQQQTANLLQSLLAARPLDKEKYSESIASVEKQIQMIALGWARARWLLYRPDKVPTALGEDIDKALRDDSRLKEIGWLKS